MAIKTTFDVVDFLTTEKNFSITATDKNGNTQTVINSDNAVRYIKRKYGLRRYSLLTGAYAATVEDAYRDFHEDYTLYMLNRQHGIDRMYQALFDYDYSPIENVDRYETESTTVDDDITYGRTDTKSGTDRTTYGKTLTDSGSDVTTYGKTDTESGTDRTTYGKTLTDSGSDVTTYGKTDTESGTDRTTYGKTLTDSGHDENVHNGTHTNVESRTGFNSPNTQTPAGQNVETWTNDTERTNYGKTETAGGNDSVNYGHTTSESGSDTLQHGKVETAGGNDSVNYGHTTTESGSDTLQHGKVETAGGSDSITYGETNTASGRDQKDVTTDRELRVHGNIGVTTNTQMINEELDLRIKSLAEMLIDNFICDYTFYS